MGLSVEAIHEMIINAHCHRNLKDASSVQMAVYDDRLEITSSGILYNVLTYEEIMSGHSKFVRVLLKVGIGKLKIIGDHREIM